MVDVIGANEVNGTTAPATSRRASHADKMALLPSRTAGDHHPAIGVVVDQQLIKAGQQRFAPGAIQPTPSRGSATADVNQVAAHVRFRAERVIDAVRASRRRSGGISRSRVQASVATTRAMRSWPRALQVWALFSTSSPDRVDLDDVPLAVVTVVHMAAGLLHEHALDQLASCEAVALPPARHETQLLERLRELLGEEVLGIAMLAPPLVLCFEPTLCLIEQDELHDGRDTA